MYRDRAATTAVRAESDAVVYGKINLVNPVRPVGKIRNYHHHPSTYSGGIEEGVAKTEELDRPIHHNSLKLGASWAASPLSFH